MLRKSIGLLAVTLGLTSQVMADTTVAGRKAESPQRARYMSLSSLSGYAFEEGFVSLRSDASHMKYMLAFRAPDSPKDPIVVLIHGATQEKSSFAMVVQSLLGQNSGLGIAAPDLVGAGETLVRNLPVTYEIPIAMNGALVQDVIKTVRAQHKRNPIYVVGVSYGVGAVFEAFKDFPELNKEVASVIAVSFGDENDSASGEVRIRGSILKLFWPFGSKRKDAGQDFYKGITSEIIYTRAALMEPTLLRPPFPWTLVALDKMTMGIWEPDFKALEKAVAKDKLHIVLALDDKFLNVERLAKEFDKWTATKSIVMVENSDHKINESTPNFLGSWVLRVADASTTAPEGAYLGDPKKGSAESLSGKVRISLKADRWPMLGNALWAMDLVNVWWAWMDPLNFWSMPPYLWADYFMYTFSKESAKIGADLEYTYELTSAEWLEMSLKKWESALDPANKDSLSRGYQEISDSMARALKKYRESIEKKKKKPTATGEGQ